MIVFYNCFQETRDNKAESSTIHINDPTFG